IAGHAGAGQRHEQIGTIGLGRRQPPDEAALAVAHERHLAGPDVGPGAQVEARRLVGEGQVLAAVGERRFGHLRAAGRGGGFVLFAAAAQRQGQLRPALEPGPGHLLPIGRKPAGEA
nr:hypothetical protein [Tanacetum cinerariifolium]